MTQFKKQTNTTRNWYYGGGDIAWSTKAAALANILGFKRKGLKIGVFENGEIVEYHWKYNDITNNGLIRKSENTNSKVIINEKEFNYFGQDSTSPTNGDYAEGIDLDGKITLYKRENEQWEVKQKR